MKTRQERYENFLKVAITKMLEPYGVDYEYVRDNSTIGEVPWYQYYTWTLQEEETFKVWFLTTFVKKKLGGKMLAERNWMWFNMMWGLKVVES